jgi:hypothetical protein
MDRRWAVALLAVAVAGACGGTGQQAPRDGGSNSSDAPTGSSSGTSSSGTASSGGPGDGSSSGGTSSSGSGDGSVPPACPTSQPDTGSSCSPQGLQCEYGTAPFSAGCDAVLVCQGMWTASQGNCPTVPFPNPACPTTTPGAADSQPCSDPGLECLFAQSPICLCDGNATKALWVCYPTDPSCPVPRPSLGTPCEAPPNVQCQYDPNGVIQSCNVNGLWQHSSSGGP